MTGNADLQDCIDHNLKETKTHPVVQKSIQFIHNEMMEILQLLFWKQPLIYSTYHILNQEG